MSPVIVYFGMAAFFSVAGLFMGYRRGRDDEWMRTVELRESSWQLLNASIEYSRPGRTELIVAVRRMRATLLSSDDCLVSKPGDKP